ncbi:MipA/OmpV family protein [Gallaecimonas mangrovi]|uniref:MipA/OmpV family protein n=1 Tax=Gallaecimonas mangrovi TaxID=2291597 RepID=UPI000E2079A8|nr:MipA/OmpV family protein [Gallaecimonas mangrovi]
MKAPLLIALTLASTSAVAEQEATRSVGIGVIESPSPYVGVDKQSLVIPVLGYEGKHFYLRGPSAGYYLVKNKAFSLAAGLQLGPSRLDPDKSDDNRMKQLDDRRYSILGGLRATIRTPLGGFEGVVATDVSGRHDGQYAEFNYKYPIIRTDSFRLVPGIGVAYYSSKYADYYYGVSADESRKSGFDEYHPGSSTNTFVNVGFNWTLNKSWMLLGSARYTWLDSSLSDSPIVNQDYSTSAYLGVVYRF